MIGGRNSTALLKENFNVIDKETDRCEATANGHIDAEGLLLSNPILLDSVWQNYLPLVK